MKFRKDINGLRALAVIAVVLFHFNSSWMPGGFAGVDVFFVISGFLMTGIIFRGMEQDNFSVLNFYVARANRIIPALALLCLALLFFGWFYLTPLEYKALSRHAASSVSFLSNFVYWREAGYFDAVSHEKWLLHTWSLSVEWQFYIIYPLVLIALRKSLPIKTLKLLLIVGTVLGFIFSVAETYKSPNAAYYLFSTRAWEMMIGGVAYLYPFTLQENRKKLVEWVGLILVIASYFLISAENLWPGYLAIFPVLGSFLIIQAQRNDSIITGNIVFQKIGTWSYSIYLWHWPFVVAIYTFALPDYYIYIGMVLSVLLGFLSYNYIEKINFQRNFPTLLSYLKCKPIYISVVIVVIGSTLFIKYEELTPIRLSNTQVLITEQQNRNPREEICGNVIEGISPACTYGSGPVKAIVIGDSHAQAQVSTIGDVAKKYGGSVLDFGLSACNTVKGLYEVSKNTNHNNCGRLVENVINIAAKKYPNVPIIIINRTSQNLYGLNENNDGEESLLSPPTRFVDKIFSARNNEYRKNFTEHMINTICEFSENNPVYVTRPTPELIRNVPLSMFRSSTLNGEIENIKIPLATYQERQRTAYKMQDEAVTKCGAKILDPVPYLCDSDYCYGSKNGIPLYFDDDHLSGYGAKTIAPIYEEVFK